MKALIDVAQNKLILVQASSFPLHPTTTLRWIDCDPSIKISTHVWDGTKLVVSPNPRPIRVWYVLKATIRARLGELSSALDTLPVWWADAPAIHNNDPQMLEVLATLGASASVILAPDPAADALFGIK